MSKRVKAPKNKVAKKAKTMSSLSKATSKYLSVSRPLGNSKKVLMKYVQGNRDLNPTIGGIPASHSFSCNGLYDPDITGVGHQPLGFDQLMPFFAKYTVIGAKIRVLFSNSDVDRSQIVGIIVTDENPTIGDLEQAIENGNAVYTQIGRAGTGDDLRQLHYQVNPNKFLGISAPLSDDRVKGTSASNPSEQCYFTVFAGPNSTSDATAVRIFVEIEIGRAHV